jgi:hypothetical protein
MTAGSSIDYDAMTQDALRGVVRAVLELVVRSGLPGDHHFYVAFSTQAAGVVMSRRLKEKYPDEMMIVLQHRFWDLAVTEEGFEVKLTFDGIPERLYIPYQALRVFHDPSVRFTLQFGEHGVGDEDQDGAGRRRRDGSEGAGRRGRSRPRSRSETEQPERGAGGQPGTSQPEPAAAPALFTPRAVETKRPVASPDTAASEPATPPTPGQQAGGAKVFSLDQFRNKK